MQRSLSCLLWLLWLSSPATTITASDVDAHVVDLAGLKEAVAFATAAHHHSPADTPMTTVEVLATEIDFEAGDEILIPAGVRVSLVSTHNPVLYGGGVTRFFTVEGELEIEGVSLVNGLAQHGGAVSVATNGTLKLSRSTLSYNRAVQQEASGRRVHSVWGEGGAVYCAGTLHVRDTKFEANAGRGGALWLGDASLPTGQATAAIYHSSFTGNKSPKGVAGAIANYGQTAITRSFFKGNVAGTAGGAIYSDDSSGDGATTTLTVHGSAFETNSAGFGMSEDVTIRGGTFAGDETCVACEDSRAAIGLKSGYCEELTRGDECTGCTSTAYQCALAKGNGATFHMTSLWW